MIKFHFSDKAMLLNDFQNAQSLACEMSALKGVKVPLSHGLCVDAQKSDYRQQAANRESI